MHTLTYGSVLWAESAPSGASNRHPMPLDGPSLRIPFLFYCMHFRHLDGFVAFLVFARLSLGSQELKRNICIEKNLCFHEKDIFNFHIGTDLFRYEAQLYFSGRKVRDFLLLPEAQTCFSWRYKFTSPRNIAVLLTKAKK